MKLTRRQLRKIITEASDDMWAAGMGDYEEEQKYSKLAAMIAPYNLGTDAEGEFYMLVDRGMDPEGALKAVTASDMFDDEDYNDYDLERDQAFEHVSASVESFLEQYPDLVDIRGMVEHSLSTGDPNNHNEQMMKIGARLAMMAKRYPRMAQAMLEELQD